MPKFVFFRGLIQMSDEHPRPFHMRFPPPAPWDEKATPYFALSLSLNRNYLFDPATRSLAVQMRIQAIWKNLSMTLWKRSVRLNLKRGRKNTSKLTCGVTLERPSSEDLTKVLLNYYRFHLP